MSIELEIKEGERERRVEQERFNRAIAQPFYDLLHWYEHDGTISTRLSIGEVLEVWAKRHEFDVQGKTK